MITWLVFAFVAVLGVKYYTSVHMTKLERRLQSVKDELLEARDAYHETQEKQGGMQSEERLYEERIVKMKEMIDDIRLRLSSKEKTEETDEISPREVSLI